MKSSIALRLVLLSFSLMPVFGIEPEKESTKTVFTLSRTEAVRFIQNLGFKDTYPLLSRSRNGDRLFIHFDEYGVFRVAVISSNSVRVAELPGQSCLNDLGDPVFWRPDISKPDIKFAPDYLLPAHAHTINFISDGKFLALGTSNDCWIAMVDSPMKKLVVIPRDVLLESVISAGNKLHIFVKGRPERNTRHNVGDILKRYEYQIEGESAVLLQMQGFDFTSHVYDFDPQTGMLLARSLDTMFPHAWLVNTRTGERRRLSLKGDALFLKEEVVRKFQQISKRGG
jgi:hypothetical protein